MRTVYYIVPVLTHYRVRFHELVHAELRQRGVEYRLLHGPPEAGATGWHDPSRLPWADVVAGTVLNFNGHSAIWQPSLKPTRGADLVILIQENRLLANYVIQLRSWLTGQRVAFFGHGRNFQTTAPNGARERWKRLWARRVHWWFTYTQSCAGLIEAQGFDGSRITVFNNAIDLSQIARERAELAPAQQAKLRAELVAGSRNVAVFVGRIYAEKRIGFLLSAAAAIRARVPDFQLVVIGDGPQAALVEAAARRHDWINYMGARYGRQKTALVSLARLWLMPGLVGLSVLDSFAHDTPMLTTKLPFHSPEIDYLVPGKNGVMLDDPDDVDAYAQAAQALLTDEAARQHLVEGGRVARQKYSIENMAERFADGVIKALDAP